MIVTTQISSLRNKLGNTGRIELPALLMKDLSLTHDVCLVKSHIALGTTKRRMPMEQALKNTTVGRVSLITSILAAAILMLALIISTIVYMQVGEGDSPVYAVAGILMLFGFAAAFAGLISGVWACVLDNVKKTYGILGICISLTATGTLLFFALLGVLL